MPYNKAAWIPSKTAPFEVGDAPVPEPEANEVVIRVHAVAINPVDAYIQSMGIIVEKYPATVGCDCAGDVVTVGSDVKNFKPGDRVLAALDMTGNRPNAGAFQFYACAFAAVTAKLPEGISYTEGCVLPLGFCTAAMAMFAKDQLALEHYPQLETLKSNGQVVLIWGGSSSVGSCGIQLAKAAGYEVAVTCSAHNLEYCKDAGADYVFDHKKESVVQDIVSALEGKSFAGVFDTVFPADTIVKSADIAHQLGGRKHVATVMIGLGPQVVPEGLPEDVTTSYCRSSCLPSNTRRIELRDG